MQMGGWVSPEERSENSLRSYRLESGRAVLWAGKVRMQEHRDARVWFDPRTHEYVVNLANGAGQVSISQSAVHELAERERCAFPDVLAPDFVRYMTAARQLAAAGITRRAA